MKEERQSKEESQVLWALELMSADKLELTPEHKRLLSIVSKKIEDYTLTYEEYVEDIAALLEDAKDDTEPKTVINNLINSLIQKYGEEVRSEQDQNGSSAVECDGEPCENSDNGGREVWGEPMAESSGLLEEVQSSDVATSDCN